MRRFLLIFAILFLAPIIGHAATCTSTETVTKCAKISTTYEKIDYEVLSDTEYIIYFRSDGYGYRVPVHGIATETACKLTTAPFERSTIMPPVVPGEIAAKSCAEGSFFAINNLTASETDICPDGFFTMPYDVSCGAGMVDTANVPNCSDDTSGESCLIPATSAPAPEYKFTATIDLSLYDDNQMDIGSPVTEFGFDLGASGTFYVDWGDGTTETIEKDNTDVVTYTHDYGTTSGTYTVKIGGLATDYSDDEDTPAISFGVDIGATSAYSQAITEIFGSLGAIFPTLSDGSQPRFPSLFYSARITEIPSGLFDGIHGAPVSNMFFIAFAYNDNLTSIPENLFSGIVGGAPYMFFGTFEWCNGLTNIPEKLFSGITGAAEYMFSGTFMNTPITNIPENLFSGITGAAEYMFTSTFMNTPITNIPENLFSGITGAAEGMFETTFEYCSSLTGPSARINGKYLYELWPDNVADWGTGMYEGATGLSDYACIPTVMGGGGEECEPAPEYKFSLTISSSFDKESWGFGISAAGTFYVDWGDGNTEKIEKTDTQYKAYIHYYTFDSRHQSYTIRIGGVATAYSDNDSAIDYSYEAGRLITEINGSLGAVFPTLPDGSQPNFGNCFRNAKITEIPAELFNGIYGAPTEGMFQNTFNSNSNLVSIPENLFSGITGAAEAVFAYTFYACSALKSIPENLFSGITGNAPHMFDGTFSDSGIISIPENLFSGITGAAEGMFSYTFTNTPITSIPENLFSGITDTADRMFGYTFQGCSMLTGPSARINGKYLYDLWPDNIADWGGSMYEGATGLSDYACIPTVMGGGGEECEPAPEYKFTATTSSNTSGFSFNISAAGTFYVDWGDGTTETIEKPDTTDTPYSHNYSTRGTYTVKIGGLATAYNSSRTVASISFESSFGTIRVVEGSLGAIFPTLTNGEQPSFFGTFASCSWLTSIPENLFSGVTGAAEGMFSGTFFATGITSIPEKLFAGITGTAAGMFESTFSDSHITSIPENLFGGITGAAEGMFERTFEACSSLTSIPENLFSGVTGAAEGMFSGTFFGSNITSIPENLFSGITGAAEGMFFETFAYCSSLTGPSARINGKPLYELWPDNIATWGSYMYEDATGLDDYAYIPVIMGGLGQVREQLCAIGISQIKISTGVSFALYAEKYTQPSLAIKYNDGICYGKLEQGNQSGTMNFNYNGTVYHLAN